MCQSCQVHVDGVWQHLLIGNAFRTPDADRGKPFTIADVQARLIRIDPQRISISRTAFAAVLHYLRTNQHSSAARRCEIRSSNDPQLAGPLCQAARAGNADVRCINYILPILQSLGIVEVDSSRPNSTWTTP